MLGLHTVSCRWPQVEPKPGYWVPCCGFLLASSKLAPGWTSERSVCSFATSYRWGCVLPRSWDTPVSCSGLGFEDASGHLRLPCCGCLLTSCWPRPGKTNFDSYICLCASTGGPFHIQVMRILYLGNEYETHKYMDWSGSWGSFGAPAPSSKGLLLPTVLSGCGVHQLVSPGFRGYTGMLFGGSGFAGFGLVGARKVT